MAGQHPLSNARYLWQEELDWSETRVHSPWTEPSTVRITLVKRLVIVLLTSHRVASNPPATPTTPLPRSRPVSLVAPTPVPVTAEPSTPKRPSRESRANEIRSRLAMETAAYEGDREQLSAERARRIQEIEDEHEAQQNELWQAFQERKDLLESELADLDL